jgi:putative membrane protein insertion efficiency factor
MIPSQTMIQPAPSARPVLSLRGVLCFLIQLYRHTLSPAQTFLFGAQTGCRFTPTCSQYALEAIEQHGAATGSLLVMKRICRCHPFAACGHDPVPRAPATFHPHPS